MGRGHVHADILRFDESDISQVRFKVLILAGHLKADGRAVRRTAGSGSADKEIMVAVSDRRRNRCVLSLGRILDEL